MTGGVDWAGLAGRLWREDSLGARALRLALLPPAAVYRAGVALRNGAYDLGLLRARRLPASSLGVGNLAVGGVGKTPVAAYLAGELVRRGLRPGVLLRGYAGGDEVIEHRARTPGAVVIADPDRRRGAQQAVARGAEVLVLDDCLQRRDIATDVLLAVVAAETGRDRIRPLPAGPWREGLRALARCDGVLVTCKAAPAGEAERLARALGPRTRAGLGVVVALELARLAPLAGEGAPLAPDWVRGRDVVAVSGIGDPRPFAAQLERLGARVRPLAFGDHHRYSAADVARVAAAAGAGAAVVTTAKDAVRLRPMWPPAAPPCLVAELEVRVTFGQDGLGRLLDRVGRAARASTTPVAATEPRDGRKPL